MRPVSVIIPTHNECGTINKVIGDVLKFPFVTEVIVADYASTDGTQRNVQALSKKDRRVILWHVPSKGIGIAYKTALPQAKNEFIVCMDGDLSHTPSYLPRMVSALAYSDLVIGSRYCRGGVSCDIPAKLVLSFVLNLVLNTLLMTSVRDMTSGFKAFRKSVLKNIPLDRLSNGYGFQFGLCFFFRRNGCELKEIPITFFKRYRGHSKLGISEIVQILSYFMWLFVCAKKKTIASFTATRL